MQAGERGNKATLKPGRRTPNAHSEHTDDQKTHFRQVLHQPVSPLTRHVAEELAVR